MLYRIYEGNMERVRKKMTRIQNKCRKYGCDFRFEEVGEEFAEIKTEDGQDVVRRFVLVEAEGVAVVNGWTFVGSVDHTDKGNIITKAIDVEVPERYYTTTPFCEHCGTNRYRKHTFIVMNEDGEFKQVGRACLQDFTFGMSAEAVASYAEAFDDLIEAETPSGGHRGRFYIATDEWMKFVAETIRHFGYVKSTEPDATRDKAMEFYEYTHGLMVRYSKVWNLVRDEYERVGFNAESPETLEMVKEAKAWIAEQEEVNNFIHNLKVACAIDYLGYEHIGIVASVFPTWRKDLERKESARKQAEADKASEWVGAVGDRVTISVSDYIVVTGWETQWGYTVIYKITDTDGNIFTWKTANDIPEGTDTITATVKEHKDYNGVKQTELTRCKCTRKAKERS